MNPYNWSKEQIESVIGGTFMAADGGGYAGSFSFQKTNIVFLKN